MTMHAQFERYRAMVEAALPLALPKDSGWAEVITDAARYSLLAGGKRLRPCLVLAAAERVGTDLRDSPSALREALPAACAMEMIHTYSLIHDDLPAMDDDALRRGKPTNHRVYGEAMAILAGDGLLNMAYETMLDAPLTQNAPERALPAIREIAERAGVRGMVAGQVLDVTMEGQPPRKDIVRYIHLHKTADLLTAPLTAGLMLAGADEAQLELGRRYGRGLGLAFQIEDDLLDLEGDVKLLGKDVGMDAQRGKMTWPAVAGVEQARQDARQAVEDAASAMEFFGERGKFLTELARQTLTRSV